MKLSEFISLGATHNPYHWMPGFFYCLFCKAYRNVTVYQTSEYDIRIFCKTCQNDFDDKPNELN